MDARLGYKELDPIEQPLTIPAVKVVKVKSPAKISKYEAKAGFVAFRCKHGHHQQCASLKCDCSCHRRGIK